MHPDGGGGGGGVGGGGGGGRGGGGRGVPLGPTDLHVGPVVALDVGLAVAGGAEAELAEGALEGLGARVQPHVDLQAALGREGGVAHVAAEQLLTFSGETHRETGI